MSKDSFEESWNELKESLSSEGGSFGEVESSFVACYQIFLDMMAGGFTEDQALRILAYGMFHSPKIEGDDL